MPSLFAISFFIVSLCVGVGGLYLAYRSRARYEKNIERGLKIVTLLIHLPPSSEDTEVGSRDVRDVVEEKLSQAETLYNVLASTAQKGYKSKFFGQRHVSFEIVATKGLVHYYAAVPFAMVAVVEQAILSSYPTAHVEETIEPNIFSPIGKINATLGGEMHLKKEFAYPIATFRDTRRDVMQSILNALSTLADQDGAAIQILLRPASGGWDKTAKSIAEGKKKNKNKKSGVGGLVNPKELASAFWKAPETKDSKPEENQLSNLDQAIVDAIEQKTRHPGYEVLIRLITSSDTRERSQVMLHNLIATFALFDAPSLNGFRFTPAKNMESFVNNFILRFFPPETNKDIVNSVELATIFHFPDQQFTSTSQLERQESKQVDGPRNIASTGFLFGHNVFRGIKKEIRLTVEDRRRHAYIVGQTGTGKSQLLESLAAQDMMNGNGFAFIDPHGDAVEDLLTMVPKERTEDIIYFSPSDMEYPLGLNLFEFDTVDQKDFLIQEAINMLYKMYDPQRQGIMGPRYEHLFRNAALTIMADPKGGTFIDIPKLFSDRQYVQQKLKHVTDQTVIDFWTKEMPDSQRSNDFGEVKSWFVSKFGAFLLNTMMRNIIGQTKSAFDLREVMDNRKVLLVNLSKGRMGELNSKLLGMIFVMKFQAAAMSRANIPEDQRQDFCLYVDEFQNFSTDSFATILSEARKYRLNLIVANQFIGQLSEEIRDAVFGNVGSVVSLRCSATDAEFLTKQFSPTFEALDLVNLPNFNAVARLMVKGVPSQPFSMTTLTTFGDNKREINPHLREALKQLSAAKYGKPRSVVDKEIAKRFESPAPAPSSFGPTSTRSPFGNTSMAPPRAPAPATSTSQSFLDEWLARRRLNQPSSSREPVSGATMPSPWQSSSPTTPGMPAHQYLSAQPLPHSFDSKSAPKDVPIPTPATSSSQFPPNDLLFDKPTRGNMASQLSTEPALPPSRDEISVQEKKAAEPKSQHISSPLSQDMASAPYLPTSPPVNAEESNNSIQTAETEQSQANKKEVIVHLKPGEIYVDSEGGVHQGADQE